MNQMNNEIQLQVWKDLAISKQVLMTAATDALGLDAECSSKELKEALETAIQRAKDADKRIADIEQKTAAQLKEMQEQVEASDKARATAEARIQEAEKGREDAERTLAAGRAENAEAIKKVRAELNEEKNKLKAITKTLADTPENVVKKMKAMKKQKVEDARVRDINEGQLRTLRKEKTELKTDLDSQKALLKQASTLVEQLREMESLCKQQRKFLENSEEAKELGDIPALNDDLLKALEQVAND